MDSPMAWWRMGGSLSDSSGNAYNGVNDGVSLTTDRFGNPDNAYDFNGSGSYVGLNSFPSITTTITITAWVRPASLSQPAFSNTNGGTIINADTDGGAAGYDLTIRSDGIIWWWPSANNDLFSNGVVSLNTWTHIGLTYENGITTLYINGEVDSTHTGSTEPQTPTFMQLGGKSWVGGYWSGALSDIRIYSTALTGVDIKEVYQQFNQASNFLQQ